MGDRAPVRDGAVVVDDRGEILEIGRTSELAGRADERHDHALLMPGVLNCHVHLTDAPVETPVPGGDGLNRWVRRLMETRRGAGHASEDFEPAVERVIARMTSGGTVALGEVCNDYRTFDPIARSGIRCRFIHELIGFVRARAQDRIALARVESDADDWPDEVAYTVGAHAPYSVSPELMELIARRDRELGTFLYQHLAEDPDERELYLSGTGPWRDYLEMVGAWEPEWTPPGCNVIDYYDRLGLIDSSYVGVHLTDATDDELALLARRGARAILCPGSNLHITGSLPRFETIWRTGLRFGLGTDGRGSDPSIDVFDEARILHERWLDHPAGLLLRALTVDGAGILGFDDLGALRPGTRPGLVVVDIDPDVDDLAVVEDRILAAHARRRIA